MAAAGGHKPTGWGHAAECSVPYAHTHTHLCDCCRLTNTQFSMEELAAIAQEAAAAGTYVAAHAYTPEAIRRAVVSGCRSIEHGNWLDEETAQLMAGELLWGH